MSEMALTADRLIVIGRGRLHRRRAHGGFIESSSRGDVLVRSAAGGRLADLLTATGRRRRAEPDGGLAVYRPGCRAISRLAADTRNPGLRAGHAAGLPGGGLHGTHRRQRRLSRRHSRPARKGGLTVVTVATRPVDVLAAEWLKLRSVRSTSLTLLVAAAGTLAVGLFATARVKADPPGFFDAVGTA